MDGKKKMLIHLGCGPNTRLSEWQDYDGSWNVRKQSWPQLVQWLVDIMYLASGKRLYKWPQHVRYLNLKKKLPFSDETIDAIYASHVWEHLYLDEALRLTEECFRVLKPGGFLRIVVPDLEELCGNYSNSNEADRAIQFNKAAMYHPLKSEGSIIQKVYSSLTGFHSHKFMYDRRFLIKIFQEAGFRGVSSRQVFDSGIIQIKSVEVEGRVGKGNGIAVEGLKR